METGTIVGHEGVGVVEEVGRQVRTLRPGNRVVIPSTSACGSGVLAAAATPPGATPPPPTVTRPSPPSSAGLQGEYARIRYANANLVRLPQEVDHDQALMLGDIAGIEPGKSVTVWGRGRWASSR